MPSKLPLEGLSTGDEVLVGRGVMDDGASLSKDISAFNFLSSG
jgi:hypothetical protein